MSDETESNAAAKATAGRYSRLTQPFSGPCPLSRGDAESENAFAERVREYYKTDRVPTPILSLDQARLLRDLSLSDSKYPPARFDADLAVTNINALPERLND